MNMKLFPYKEPNSKCWVFDDPTTELKAEAFVCGMSEMIDKIIETKALPDTDKGFTMTFGAEPFDGADVTLHWMQEGNLSFKSKDGKEHSVLIGNWYGGMVADKPMAGWLCPALLKYFVEPPKMLYVGAAALPEGFDPIWHDAPKKAFVYDSDEVTEDDLEWSMMTYD